MLPGMRFCVNLDWICLEEVGCARLVFRKRHTRLQSAIRFKQGLALIIVVVFPLHGDTYHGHEFEVGITHSTNRILLRNLGTGGQHMRHCGQYSVTHGTGKQM